MLTSYSYIKIILRILPPLPNPFNLIPTHPLLRNQFHYFLVQLPVFCFVKINKYIHIYIFQFIIHQSLSSSSQTPSCSCRVLYYVMLCHLFNQTLVDVHLDHFQSFLLQTVQQRKTLWLFSFCSCRRGIFRVNFRKWDC